jgi:anti-sigma B factor antagonist
MRRLVASELNRSPAPLVLDLSGEIRIDTEGIDAVVSAATQARRIRYLALLAGVRGHPVGIALADAELLELLEIFTADSDT